MRAIYIIFIICICVFLCNSQVYFVQASGTNDDFKVTVGPKGWATVATNASTNVEEDSATLNGFLISDGGAVCQYAFDYDLDSGVPYAVSTAWAGAIHSPIAFNQNILLLTKGELYYFRAKARTGNGTSYGGEKMFLTKPDPPMIFLAKPNSSSVQINLKWINGNGADKTVVLRKINSYPLNRLDGIVIYNGTSNKYDDNAVVAGMHYYYRAWSYCSEGGLYRYSDDYEEDNCIALTPALFDLRNIVVLDDCIPLLEINLQVENKGDYMADVTIVWTLVREDIGVLLDAGSNTFAVASHAIVPYTINPITTYVGLVRITFSTTGVSVFDIFTTTAPVSPPSGGGGFAPPTKPPVVPPVLPTIPTVAGIELPCLLLILFAIILILLIIIIIWKRKKKKR